MYQNLARYVSLRNWFCPDAKKWKNYPLIYPNHGHYLDHMEVLKISDINFTWSVNILATLIYL